MLFFLVLLSGLVETMQAGNWDMWYKADEVLTSVMQFLANYGVG